MGKRINLSASFKTYREESSPPAYSESDSDNESYCGFQGPCMMSSNTSNPISELSPDLTKAFVSNILNATSSVPTSKVSLVEKNFACLCKVFPQSEEGENPIKKNFQLSLESGALDFCIKAAEIQGKDNRLPIMGNTHNDGIQLSSPLLPTLQRSLKVTTILDLLKRKFPELTQSIYDQKIPRCVFAVPVPVNQEKRGSFFPQIQVNGYQANGCIAYIAWDSSGLELAHGFKKKKCAILLKNNTAFCGEILSQGNLEGIEKASGASAYFMTAKVTVIGIFIPELVSTASSRLESCSVDEFVCDNSDLIKRGGGPSFKQERLACDGPTEYLRERGGGSNLLSTDTAFGLLGVSGAEVTTDQRTDLLDRRLRTGEKPSLFCLEFIPQFHSEAEPVTRDDLEMAIDMQFQESMLSMYPQKV